MMTFFLIKSILYIVYSYFETGFKTKDSFIIDIWFSFIALWSAYDLLLNIKKRLIGCWYTVDQIYYYVVIIISLFTEFFYLFLNTNCHNTGSYIIPLAWIFHFIVSLIIIK